MTDWLPQVGANLPAPFCRRVLSFQYHLEGGAVRSQRTVRAYLEGLVIFGEWLLAEGHSGVVEEITPELIRRFLREYGARTHTRTGERLSASTVNNRGRALQAFFRWWAEEYEAPDPMAKVKIPKPADETIACLGVADLRALLAACEGKDFQARRDYAFIRFLIDTGARLQEAALLRTTDLDLRQRKARVLGKGGKPRDCVFGPKTVRALDRYRDLRDTHPQTHKPGFWLGRGHEGPLTVSGAYQIVHDRAALAAAAAKDPVQAARLRSIHPHMLRHTAAARYLLAGGQQQNLQAHFGWDSAAMVARYVKAVSALIAEEEYHRLDVGDDI